MGSYIQSGDGASKINILGRTVDTRVCSDLHIQIITKMSGAIPMYEAIAPLSLLLTAVMPDPTIIEKQKQAYARMLEAQLNQGVSVLDTQVKNQKDYLLDQAHQQKNQFTLQNEMEVKQQEMAVQQQ